MSVNADKSLPLFFNSQQRIFKTKLVSFTNLLAVGSPNMIFISPIFCTICTLFLWRQLWAFCQLVSLCTVWTCASPTLNVKTVQFICLLTTCLAWEGEALRLKNEPGLINSRHFIEEAQDYKTEQEQHLPVRARATSQLLTAKVAQLFPASLKASASPTSNKN